jgi:hypothetical protein
LSTCSGTGSGQQGTGDLQLYAWKYSSNREKAVIEFGVTEIEGVPTYFVREDLRDYSRKNIFCPALQYGESFADPVSCLDLLQNAMSQAVLNQHCNFECHCQIHLSEFSF